MKSSSKHLSFVVVGHVDHGKSPFIGRLLYDAGALAADKLAELDRLAGSDGKRDFALLLDHLEEERRDTMTIDTTQVFFETLNRCYTLVDAAQGQSIGVVLGDGMPARRWEILRWGRSSFRRINPW